MQNLLSFSFWVGLQLLLPIILILKFILNKFYAFKFDITELFIF